MSADNKRGLKASLDTADSKALDVYSNLVRALGERSSGSNAWNRLENSELGCFFQFLVHECVFSFRLSWFLQDKNEATH